MRVALDFVDMSAECAKGVAAVLSKFEKSDQPALSELSEELKTDSRNYGADVPLSSLKKLAEVMTNYAQNHDFIQSLGNEVPNPPKT